MELLIGLVVLGVSLAIALALPVVSFLRASRADRETRRLSAEVAALRRELDAWRTASAAADIGAPAHAPVPDPAWHATVHGLQGSARPASPAVEPPPATIDDDVESPAGATGTIETVAGRDATGDVTAAPPLPVAPPPATSTASLEERIGARWLLYAGMGALILGVSYFVKFAFDNGWVSEPLRVVVGLAAGAALVVTGTRFARRGLPLFGHVLAGGGVVALYVALYAALHLYALVPAGTAFVAMVGVTAYAAWLAHRLRAQPLALLALVGGFATPALVGGDGSQLVLFSYVALLVAGGSVLALRHAWPAVPLTAYALTVLTVAVWAAQSYSSAAWLRTELFLTLYVALFVAVTVALRRRATNDAALRVVVALLATAPVVYHVASVAVLGTQPGPLLVYFVLFTVAGLSVAHHTGLPWLRSAVLLLVAVPLMAWMSGLRRPGWYPGAIITVCAVYGLHLAGQWRSVSDDEAPADVPLAEVVHTHLNGLLLPAALYAFLAGRAAWWNPPMLTLLAGWNGLLTLVTAGRVATLPWQFGAVAATLAAVAVGVWFDGPAVAVGWAMEGAAIGWLAIRRDDRWLGAGSAVLFAIGALRLIDMLGEPLALSSAPVANTRTLAVGLVVGAAAWVAGLLRRPGDEAEPPARTLLVLGAHVLAIAWLSAEIHALFGARAYLASAADRPAGAARAELFEQVALSVAWALYAVGLIAAGMVRRYPPVRYLGIALFGLTIVKVLLHDIAELDRVYQMLSVLGVGGLLLLASYLYQRMAAGRAAGIRATAAETSRGDGDAGPAAAPPTDAAEPLD